MTSAPPPAAPRLAAGPAIQREEALGPGVKRICLEYLERACTALAHPEAGREAGIHTARKAMKRARAMIRLTRDVVGEAAFRNENAVLRDGARKIATARDRTVRLLTLERLLERHAASLPAGAFAALRERLAAEREGVGRRRRGHSGGDNRHPHHAAHLPAALRRLDGGGRRARRGARRLRRHRPGPPPGVPPGAVPDEGGLPAGDEAAFHRWRKSAKYLRYQIEALAPAWPEVLGALAAAADRLAETLGDEHDCAVLGEAVAADPGLLPDEAERRLLAALVAEEQDRLRRLARPLGERVYAEPPEAFVSRLGSYWRAWRR